MFGSAKPAAKLTQIGVLKPSLKGTKLMKQNRREGDVATELRPVQELQDSESAVTCICFGQERLHRSYILLAAASKDGTVVIYRCYRTEMELLMVEFWGAHGRMSGEEDDFFRGRIMSAILEQGMFGVEKVLYHSDYVIHTRFSPR